MKKKEELVWGVGRRKCVIHVTEFMLRIENQRFVHHGTKEQAVRDFENLAHLPATDLVTRDRAWTTNGSPAPRKALLFRQVQVGQQLSDIFHWRDRIHTANHSNPSPAQRLFEYVHGTSPVVSNAMRGLDGKVDVDKLLYEAIRRNSSMFTLTGACGRCSLVTAPSRRVV
jgi:hypothetical protein